jgi:hypothetical protein
LAELVKELNVKYHSIYMVPERMKLAEKIKTQTGEEVIAFSPKNAEKLREMISKPMTDKMISINELAEALKLNKYEMTKVLNHLRIVPKKARRLQDSRPILAIYKKRIKDIRKSAKEMF